MLQLSSSKRILILSISLFISVLFSCSKKNAGNPTPKQTSGITSLSVNTGAYTTTVTITGTGFSANATDQQVYFNGKAATITAATSTQLNTSVPLGAGSGPVTVKLKDGTTVTGPLFTYQLTWMVSTVAGNGVSGLATETDTLETFRNLNGITVDATGNLLAADSHNNSIRKISSTGVVSTIAGNGSSGSADGPGTSATFSYPCDLTVDKSGNIFVTDYSNGTIRKIDSKNTVSTFAGTAIGQAGYQDGTGAAARFTSPCGITSDAAGNLYVADLNNNMIRKITPDAVVSTLTGVLGKGNSAGLVAPYGIAVDGSGNVFATDIDILKVIKVTPAGAATVFAGSGMKTSTNGTGIAASFDQAISFEAFDKNGNLYIADGTVIREIDPNGVVTNFAGNATAGFTNGLLATATFNFLKGITIDDKGNIYVTDVGNKAIRKISLQ